MAQEEARPPASADAASARMRVVVRADPVELARTAADRIAAAAAESVAARGRFVLALAGGRTPQTLYHLLAGEYRERVPWRRTVALFGDERCVPPDDPASNYGMIARALLEHVPIAAENVHRIEGERPPDAAARDHEAVLRATLPDARGTAALIDFALLGVGADGHTASLFPGSAALEERDRWVLPVEAPAPAAPRSRITLTLPLLGRALEVCFLCAGAGKRAVVAAILGSTRDEGGVARYPAARVRGLERTAWLLDHAAAGELQSVER